MNQIRIQKQIKINHQKRMTQSLEINVGPEINLIAINCTILRHLNLLEDLSGSIDLT